MKLALQVQQVPRAEVAEFAIDCSVAVLRDKFGEGGIAVQPAGQARRSSSQLNIWIAQSSCHEAIQLMARWLWSWKSPSLGHRLWAANEGNSREMARMARARNRVAAGKPCEKPCQAAIPAAR